MKIKELIKKIVYLIIDGDWFLYRPQYKVSNYKVEINKTDGDIWPSYPHIHMIDDDIKLDIYTGKMYRIQTRKEIGQSSDKDMEKIWNDRKNLEIIMFQRENKPINVGKLEEIPYKWINVENIEWLKRNYNIK